MLIAKILENLGKEYSRQLRPLFLIKSRITTVNLVAFVLPFSSAHTCVCTHTHSIRRESIVFTSFSRGSEAQRNTESLTYKHSYLIKIQDV